LLRRPSRYRAPIIKLPPKTIRQRHEIGHAFPDFWACLSSKCVAELGYVEAATVPQQELFKSKIACIAIGKIEH